MRSLTASIATVWILAFAIAGCGAPRPTSSVEPPSVVASLNSSLSQGHDRDDDDGIASHDDGNNDSVTKQGHAARPVDQAAITALVSRFYNAAAKGDGALGCSLLEPTFEASVVEDYAHASGPRYLRGGRTCQQVMRMLFGHDHALLVSEAARIQVTAVRITGAHGLAVLSFGTPLERQMPVQRGHGTWKIAELLDRELL